MKRYNVKCRKIEAGSRDAYRDHASGYIEHHGGDDGESVEVGGTARYSVELDEAGVRAFRGASNLLSIEEAPVDTAYSEPDEAAGETGYGVVHNGVDRDMLTMHGMLDLAPGALKPLLMVADTGATGNEYVASRMLDKWTWFSDDGMGRNSHGPWCLGAATPPEAGRFVISAKVLGDNGSGSSANTVAALYRFARLCRDRGVPGVASLSLGSRSPSEAYRDAIHFCIAVGVEVVAAAGNDSRRDGIGYPAAYCSSVGAMHRSGSAANFSNRNANHSLPDVYALGFSVSGIGGVKSGTSMATPGVARAVWYALSRGMGAANARANLRSHGKGRVLDCGRFLASLPEKTPETPPAKEPESGIRWEVRTGRFAVRENAERQATALAKDGYPSVIIERKVGA